ncbi:MAG: V-type ATP synthase subunit D [Firmicutes bacterium]|nr:V-type ATP synthase subunit D [Bacillota bacterium]
MARLRVNPTRMELKRLTARLHTATRGHKLLKDKTDEMIRRFTVFARRNKELRTQIEKSLAAAMKQFVLARALTPPATLDETLLMPSRTVSISTQTAAIMGVSVPIIQIAPSKSDDLFPYSFTSVTAEMDVSIATLNQLTEKLLKLAEAEKTTNMLADEIQKNKRRVNALEHVMIPQLEETIKYIRFKLEENQRGALARLMKVKSSHNE